MSHANTRDTGVSLSVADTVATICIRRPEKMNALTVGDLRTIQMICSDINADASVRAVVLTSNTDGQKRPVFCAGYNVSQFGDVAHDPRAFEQTVNAVAGLRPVVVCALNGSVYGGATDLALASDLRVALAGCEFRMPACALGLHYYPSGLQRFIAAFGASGAKLAFLSARPLSVERLAAMGVFCDVYSAADFQSGVDRLVADVVALAPVAAQATKASIDELVHGNCDFEILRAREIKTLQSRDFAEGRLAFSEHRRAIFQGN